MAIRVRGAGSGPGQRLDLVVRMAPFYPGGVSRYDDTFNERAFGDPGVFLERYVERAHHVEVQVFGWGDRRVEHLRLCRARRERRRVPGRTSGVWTKRRALPHLR